MSFKSRPLVTVETYTSGISYHNALCNNRLLLTAERCTRHTVHCGFGVSRVGPTVCYPCRQAVDLNSPTDVPFNNNLYPRSDLQSPNGTIQLCVRAPIMKEPDFPVAQSSSSPSRGSHTGRIRTRHAFRNTARYHNTHHPHIDCDTAFPSSSCSAHQADQPFRPRRIRSTAIFHC